jgi:hypothetical protein
MDFHSAVAFARVLKQYFSFRELSRDFNVCSHQNLRNCNNPDILPEVPGTNVNQSGRPVDIEGRRVPCLPLGLPPYNPLAERSLSV